LSGLAYDLCTGEFVGTGFSPDEFRAGDFWAVGFLVDDFLVGNFLLFSGRFNKMDFPEMIWLLMRPLHKGGDSHLR